MKKFIKKTITTIINGSLKNTYLYGFINFLFENGGMTFRSFVIRNISKPSSGKIWKTKLLNKKYVQVPINEDQKSWQFCYNYKWHNIGLSKVEAVLNNYYDITFSYIDVGSNLGLRALYSMSINRPVVLFEPNEDLHSYTKKVFQVNKFNNYKVEGICLSNNEGDSDFFISGSSYMSSLNKSLAQDDLYGGIIETRKVQVTKLDHYLSDKPSIVPKIIKIDAEGHDINVVQGAINTIKKHSPSFIIEANSTLCKQNLIVLLSSYSYTFFGIINNTSQPLTNDVYSSQCSDILFVKDKGLIEKINHSLSS